MAKLKLIVLAAMVAVAPLTFTPPGTTADATGTVRTYVVVYKAGASSAGASRLVGAAGGTVVANYSEIGVVVARSGDDAFESRVRGKSGIEGVASTERFGSSSSRDFTEVSSVAAAPAPASDGEPLAAWQWDMEQINAFAAHEVDGGDPAVVAGVLSTGLDFTHPDLAPNYRADLSVDCASGVATPLAAGNDIHGLGTHSAGTIAAAVNGIGIAGVAPNVGIAGVKTSNDDGFFFPEMVVCGYMWVASQGIDVASSGFFVDPWLWNCKNDSAQRAILTAVQRAVAHARSKGTVVVAGVGNFSDDLSNPTQDVTSPTTSPVTRKVNKACSVLPVELPGVIGVSATGDLSLKSYYSSYGTSVVDIAAPGGDRRYQATADPGGGRVLSTFPSAVPCAISTTDSGAKYCWLQGTTIAAPHAAGLAAILLSQGVAPTSVEARMESSANPLPCPDTSQPIYAENPSANNGAPQTCTGPSGHNGFYGAGEIDVLAAIS